MIEEGTLDPLELERVIVDLSRSVAEDLGPLDQGRGPAARNPAAEAQAHQLTLDGLDSLSKDRITRGLGPLTDAEEDEIVERVQARLFGLGELDRLVRDSTVENVFCNGWDQVWVRRADGTKEQVPPIAASDEALTDLIRQAAAREGRVERRFDRGQPWVSFRLSDGSRLTAVQEVSGRTVFALRRHRHSDTDLEDLRRLGTVGTTLAMLLRAAVRARFNILVVGGTDAGKTTLLRALLNEIPPGERIITVEDALELQLAAHQGRHDDVVELECREANIEGQGETTMRDLTRLALRLSPDRVIVGEARGPEILDMFQAMSQGNDGSMGTLHARTSADAFVQITRYALKAPEHLTPEAVAVDIAASLDWVLHIHKLPDGRRVVSSLREVVGYDGSQVVSNELFAPGPDGRASYSGVSMQERSLDRLQVQGFDPSTLDIAGGGWLT